MKVHNQTETIQRQIQAQYRNIQDICNQIITDVLIASRNDNVHIKANDEHHTIQKSNIVLNVLTKLLKLLDTINNHLNKIHSDNQCQSSNNLSQISNEVLESIITLCKKTLKARKRKVATKKDNTMK